MRKVTKDLSKIPISLNSKQTNKRRDEIIKSGKYISEDIYNSRYKQNDIKETLEKIYYKKCAYCEQKIGDNFYHIEHFRPKSEYYWLAYSWDNLLICCDKCNVYKSDNFDINGERVIYSESHLKDIHKLTDKYRSEKPKMINPEIDDIESFIEFDRYGNIKSKDERVDYTIKVCKIDREEASCERKRVLDKLKNDYFSELLSNRENASVIIRKFLRDSQDLKEEYTLFRKWIVKNMKNILSKIDITNQLPPPSQGSKPNS